MPLSKTDRRQNRKKTVVKEGTEIKTILKDLAELDAKAPRHRFADYPISRRTIEGLKNAGFVKPTKIQKLTLVPALEGKDILAAAKTGSGKTLAFLIPIVERLWRSKWSKYDGVGAIVISPTRELAMQTFECLSTAGKKHEMSAGLIIGGTAFENEQANICLTNILICTPGRLLQHLDETPNFDCSMLQILVLDEADKILELGFAKSMDAIIQGMPSSRQTMLFSATQTNSVKDLARLSLNNPQQISADAEAAAATPDKLVQAYISCELENKINILFSFIKSHLASKILVFVSSCKQVRFLYEMLKRTRPGTPLLALYGKQKQTKRVAIYNDFAKKKSAVLFATDIASRGLDFPNVDWVFQLDCPDSVDTYIHRVGRTARFDREGKALMTLLPSENLMIELLTKKGIIVQKTEVAVDKTTSVTPVLQSLCASDTELKYLAQKCFISYLRSVFLQSNKTIFDVEKLSLEGFSKCLGLQSTPQIKFTKKKKKKMTEKVVDVPKIDLKSRNRMGSESEQDDDDDDDENDDDDSQQEDSGSEVETKVQPPSKFEALRKRTNVGVLAPHRLAIQSKSSNNNNDGGGGGGLMDNQDEDEDLFVKKSNPLHETLEDLPDDDSEQLSQSKKKKKTKLTKVSKLKEDGGKNSHVKFSTDGKAVDERTRLVGLDMADIELAKQTLAKDLDIVDKAAEKIQRADVLDKEVQKQARRAKKLAKKIKRKHAEAELEGPGDGGGVQLGSFSDNNDDKDDDDDGQSDGGFEGPGNFDETFTGGSSKKRRTVQDDEDLALRLLTGGV